MGTQSTRQWPEAKNFVQETDTNRDLIQAALASVAALNNEKIDKYFENGFQAKLAQKDIRDFKEKHGLDVNDTIDIALLKTIEQAAARDKNDPLETRRNKTFAHNQIARLTDVPGYRPPPRRFDLDDFPLGDPAAAKEAGDRIRYHTAPSGTATSPPPAGPCRPGYNLC